MGDERETPKSRSDMLSFALAAGAGTACVAVLQLLSFGYFVWVALVLFAIGLVGYGHYLIWGRDAMREVAAEREKFLREQAREREAAEGWRG